MTRNGIYKVAGLRGLFIARLSFVFALLLVFCFSAIAADTGVMESWDIAGQMKNWVLDTTKASMSNPGGYLDVLFPTIYGPPSPDDANIYTVTNTYIGNYVAAGVTHVSFKFMAKNVEPSFVWFCWRSAVGGREWYRVLPTPSVNEWTNYTVNIASSAGWINSAGGGAAEFQSDSASVSWIGVRIMRRASDIEHYLLDDFVLLGVDDGTDSDHDGMSDYAERRAGSDPDDPDSFFKARMEANSSASSGIVLKWNSMTNRTYTVLRGEELPGSFNPLSSGIPATIPENTYDDTTATGSVYFYKVIVE